MAIKRQWHGLALAACMTMAVAAGGTLAADIPMVTGEHWTTSSDDMKKAYLIGIANQMPTLRKNIFPSFFKVFWK